MLEINKTYRIRYVPRENYVEFLGYDFGRPFFLLEKLEYSKTKLICILHKKSCGIWGGRGGIVLTAPTVYILAVIDVESGTAKILDYKEPRYKWRATRTDFHNRMVTYASRYFSGGQNG